MNRYFNNSCLEIKGATLKWENMCLEYICVCFYKMRSYYIHCSTTLTIIWKMTIFSFLGNKLDFSDTKNSNFALCIVVVKKNNESNSNTDSTKIFFALFTK